MADVFVSYSSEDREWVRVLAAAIEGQGWSVWWDRVILVGKSYHTIIEEEIDRCGCLVVVWSAVSAKSSWVLNEATEGSRRNILVPILRGTPKVPIGFRHLQGAQMEIESPQVSGRQFEFLVESMRAIAEPSRKVHAMAAPPPRNMAAEAELQAKAKPKPNTALSPAAAWPFPKKK